MTDAARVVLLPNPAFLDGWEPEPGVDPFLVTLQGVAPWANRCAIWPLGYPGGADDDGPLPADPSERDAFLARAWEAAGDAAERAYGEGLRLAAAALWAGNEALLDNHDATWASCSEIRLPPGQVEELRAWWVAHGLPPDLYVPGESREQRLAAFIASQQPGQA